MKKFGSHYFKEEIIYWDSLKLRTCDVRHMKYSTPHTKYSCQNELLESHQAIRLNIQLCEKCIR
jgi:hypothetical protein